MKTEISDATAAAIDEAINGINRKYLAGIADTVYAKVVVGIAYRAGFEAGQRGLEEALTEKAHLISAMKDCWVAMRAAEEELQRLRAEKPEVVSAEHLGFWR